MMSSSCALLSMSVETWKRPVLLLCLHLRRKMRRLDGLYGARANLIFLPEASGLEHDMRKGTDQPACFSSNFGLCDIGGAAALMLGVACWL